MSSTPIVTVLRSSNEHDDITMFIATVPIYKELDTVLPSSSSDRAQCESQLFVRMVGKKIEKRGGGDFYFIFYELTLDGKSMPLLKFLLLFRCVFEAIFKIKISRVS
jgi:hypothetical protein